MGYGKSFARAILPGCSCAFQLFGVEVALFAADAPGWAFSALRRRIISMELLPGVIINKQEVIAEFGLSSALADKILLELSRAELIEMRSKSSAVVTAKMPANVRAAVFIRAAIEIEAVRQAAMHRDDALCEMLRNNIGDQEEAVEAGDVGGFESLDGVMHAAIVATTGQGAASLILDAARASLDRMRWLALVRGSVAESLDQHRLIVHAICEGEPELAVAGIRAHLDLVVANTLDDVPAFRAGCSGRFN